MSGHRVVRRPGADDVMVLKKEMIHAQTLMDRMTQDSEKERSSLEKDNAKYVQQCLV